MEVLYSSAPVTMGNTFHDLHEFHFVPLVGWKHSDTAASQDPLSPLCFIDGEVMELGLALYSSAPVTTGNTFHDLPRLR
jgi:hypothetical protein